MREGPLQNQGSSDAFSADEAHRRVAKPGPWRVFLSRTSELREYPKPGASYVDRAERAVSAAGHAFTDMADFASADQRSASLCAERVGQCDVYVGILGLRYGSPVRDQPELSYTELEFDTATAQGLPRLVFLLDGDSDEPVGLPAKALIDREFGARQDAFRQRVSTSSELTVQRFRDPHQLELLVERSLRQLAERSATSRPPSPPPAPTRPGWCWPTAWDFSTHLQEKRAGFVGRAWLFAEVRAWATSTDPTTAQALLISADYGVGKSAFLAELVANALEGGGPEGLGEGQRGAGLPIAAHHFCDHASSATLAPGEFVSGVAAQLARALPAYRAALEADAAGGPRARLDQANRDPSGAWEQAVLAPLARIAPPAGAWLLVVDGLDEALEHRPASKDAPALTIVDLLARHTRRLPPWLRVLATSRPREEVLCPLGEAFTLRQIDAERAANLDD